MKKIFTSILCAALSFAAVCGAAACADTPSEGKAQLSFAGSLQELYGGTDGYPQAVIVAKTSVIENDPGAVARVESLMAGSADFLASTVPFEIASLLSSCYAPDLAPSFNANNLTAQVIANCSVKYTPAATCKETVKEFLTALKGMDGDLVKHEPEEAFFYAGGTATWVPTNSYNVYAPDGAPALALANAISQSRIAGGSSGVGFTFHVVASDEIRLQVTGTSPAADFCILPVNLAANLLWNGENYKMLGTVTNGNMFLLSTSTDLPEITKTNIASLKGKKVGVIQLANVPGLTLRLSLEKAGISYKILNESDASLDPEKVNLAAVTPNDVTLAGGYDYFLCPEPAASAKVKATAAK